MWKLVQTVVVLSLPALAFAGPGHKKVHQPSGQIARGPSSGHPDQAGHRGDAGGTPFGDYWHLPPPHESSGQPTDRIGAGSLRPGERR